MDTAAPLRTPYHGRLAAYAVVNLHPQPLAPIYLKAIDPLTGADVPGRQPLELGHHGTWALSPDGATLALGWSPAGDDDGPERLSLVDTARWEKRETSFQDGIARLFWSPDVSRIYVETYRCADSFCDAKPQARLVTLDSATGDVKAEGELPFGGYQSLLAPDGTTLYLFGREEVDPQVVEQPPPPRLVAFDVRTGRVRAQLELPDLLYGSRKEADPSGDYYAQYLPGVAMSPDGQRMYIAYPDRGRIDVVDLQTMRLEHSAEVRRPSSHFDRFLSLFAGRAEAKGGPTNGASLSVSADGRFLYYGRHGERPPADANGNYQSTDTGFQVVDAGSFDVLTELDSSPANQFHAFLADASEQYIFTLRGIQLVVRDPHDLHVLSSGDLGAVYDLLVGPAPPTGR